VDFENEGELPGAAVAAAGGMAPPLGD